jgi:2-polyprenyl-3-methyl-5-hydroxy-6-metoxy-1,4-benzoquinol methylase
VTLPGPAGYHYPDSTSSHAHAYLAQSVLAILEDLVERGAERSVFDLGCGNGAFAAYLEKRGYSVIGVDPSEEGVAQARAANPASRIYEGSAYDDLRAMYGQFPIVVSIEVVEHIYSPSRYAATLYDLVEEGGSAVISTPYHGYLKNLALAVTGKLDAHFTALWEHGHIKFWSRKTLTELLTQAGFKEVWYRRVGRVAPLAKSMIAVARK